MRTFLVGGAVRDRLLGRESKDLDYVVVGSTQEEMLAAGFVQVGADFPVFLHPVTKHEYALARTERKSGTGYNGFETYTSGVTLEDDLLRRDLTINAIAQAEDGSFIDPFGGMDDIKNRVLRHVSPAFAEDPLRVLRVARFVARYIHLGFTVAEETMDLMRDLVDSGELNNLTAARIWQETESALNERDPAQFFDVLEDTGALAVIMPEIAGRHIDMLGEADSLRNASQRFAVLTMTLHEDSIEELCVRINAPNDFTRLSKTAAKIWQAFNPDTLLELFELCDAFRRPDVFLNALDAAYSVATWAPKDSIKDALAQCMAIGGQQFIDAGFVGKEVGDQIRARRQAILVQRRQLMGIAQ